MPNNSKKWTEEERKEFGKKMAEARKKKATEPKPKDTVEISVDDLNQIMNRLNQLEKKDFSQPAQVTSRGLIGTVDKYNVDPANYPDFTDRLAREPKFRQFAFDVNYELEYEVNVTSYETKDGVNMREPRFNLQLNRVVLDDEGNPTTKRIIVRKFVMHEDPQAALTIARNNGIEVDSTREMDFLNEMRYLRARDWLMGLFYPKPSHRLRNKRQEVIGGKLVEVFDINSENPQTIPFGELKSKL